LPATTIHLQATAPIAERVLLPGDPGRALQLAQSLLREPRMCNHARGLWGYTGAAPDGEPLTIQSTGMGGPSAAIVVEELIALGARRLIRVSSCGALDPSLELGDLVLVREAIAADGASRALGAGERVAASPVLSAAIERSTPELAAAGVVVSTDLFYDTDRARITRWAAEGALAVEMEAATILRTAELHGLGAACLLVVSDRLSSARKRAPIDAAALDPAVQRMGRVALEALAT